MIDSFSGVNRFLSNFYPAIVYMGGVDYPTVEHAFQAAKTDDRKERIQIRLCLTAGQAKRMGRKCTRRDDWDDVRVMVMKQLLIQKFSVGTVAQRWLLNTGRQKLVEGNDWNDTFWGVCDGEGENMLGRLLMEIRDDRLDSPANWPPELLHVRDHW